MTPLEIEVLLHSYTTPVPHPRRYAPAVAKAIEMFMDNGIIEKYPSSNSALNFCYQTTSRGKAMVKALCSTPFPEQKWVDQDDNIIEI